jgi:hypothetical protein
MGVRRVQTNIVVSIVGISEGTILVVAFDHCTLRPVGVAYVPPPAKAHKVQGTLSLSDSEVVFDLVALHEWYDVSWQLWSYSSDWTLVRGELFADSCCVG